MDRLQPRLPMAGLERAGWRLVYSAEPNLAMADNDARREEHDWRFSLGFAADKDSIVQDVLPDSPAGRAGMAGGEKLLGVGGHVYTPRAVEAALAEAKGGTAPIEVVAAYGDAIVTYKLDAHGGPRAPHLERIAERPDILAEILRPRAPPTTP